MYGDKGSAEKEIHYDPLLPSQRYKKNMIALRKIHKEVCINNTHQLNFEGSIDQAK